MNLESWAQMLKKTGATGIVGRADHFYKVTESSSIYGNVDKLFFSQKWEKKSIKSLADRVCTFTSYLQFTK